MTRYTDGDKSVEAVRWEKNGDHPQDYANDKDGFNRHGELQTYSAAFMREHDWEGQVVRRFRNPFVEGTSECPQCSRTMHVHGWIDEGDEGDTVCPGDYVVTREEGGHYSVDPETFESRFAPV